MIFGLGTYAIGFLAGTLSTLSPCVLPLIPIVLGTASGAHKYGPVALAGGLTVSFALLGTGLAYAGTAIGLQADVVRHVGALMLGIFGIVLLSSSLQYRFAAVTSSVGTRADSLLARFQISGLTGQWVVGLLLGLVWSPCAGPALGAAIGLASQGHQLGPILLFMAVFGLGASVPLLVLGLLGRRALGGVRNTLLRTGQIGKIVLGIAFVGLSAAMLTGWDQHAEAWLVEHSPDWLTALTTRY